ncbi:twin-arginine translocation signal domain-containing protein [Pseudomonas sp. ATCC 13867]
MSRRSLLRAGAAAPCAASIGTPLPVCF